MKHFQLDTAVVGGGISGVYSAWRLQQAYGNEQKIALFEYSNRIGGRLFSRQLPGLEHIVAELGGMRYIYDTQPLVADLVDHLSLKTKPFPMGSNIPQNAPVGSADNLLYMRGKYFRERDYSENPNRIPYNLNWSEQGYSPSGMQVKLMNFLCPGFIEKSFCEQMHTKVFGKEVWKWGYWNLLAKVLSNEAYQFLRDTSGYDGTVSNANATMVLPATEYSNSTQFLSLVDGFQALPITIANAFKCASGVLNSEKRIHLNHCLTEIHIHEENEYRYRLVFRKTKTDANNKTTILSDTEVVISAKKIILAMPRRSLELIKSSFFEQEWLKENIPSVMTIKAFKLFLGYETPWWRSLGLVAGRSITDLPIRQVYYLGTECEESESQASMNSLLMAAYSDMGEVDFWKGLEKGHKFTGFLPSSYKEKMVGKDAVLANEFSITQSMVEAAHKQVEEVHNQKDIPAPYTALYHEWGEDPLGGAWHAWKANYRLDKIMYRMRKPANSENIFIVGEAYSYQQGWVEGALCTAESVLEEYFDLPQPDWLRDTGYQYLPVTCKTGCDQKGVHSAKSCNCSSVLEKVTQFAYSKINNVE